MKRRLRTVLAVLAMIAPNRVRRWVLTRLLGHRIHPTAHVGRSLIMVDRLEMGPQAAIGHLNLIRNLERVVLEEEAVIGFLNWVNATTRQPDKYVDHPHRRLELVMRRGSAITALHLLDCCDSIELGELTQVGGWFTQIMTHAADIERGRQAVAPIVIGPRGLICTRCVITPGVTIADRVVVGAGSVVTKDLGKPCSLYAGAPAVWRREMDPEAGYFTRPTAHVP